MRRRQQSIANRGRRTTNKLKMSAQNGQEVNIVDRDERKRLRKELIEKTENDGNLMSASSGDGNAKNSYRTGIHQTEDSLFYLDNRKHKGLQNVTSYRIKTNEAESKRRIEDDNIRRARLSKLQTEALASAKANAAIEIKWAELLEQDIPQELHQEIQVQMDACNVIIKSKDELISSFQNQLRNKDEEYVRTIRRQGDDIDALLSRIKQEFKELQVEYNKEFEAIEEAYDDEREQIIREHTKEIDDLFELNRSKENIFKESKQRNEGKYQEEIDELISTGADQYNKLKIQLEMNIQALKQQLEEIRATYQLNTEKLDYNYRVLTELDVEKNAELSRYKRRLNKLKGQLNVLVARYTEMETSDSKTNSELTEHYRNLTLKYKDLQAKFRHFEVADTTKYGEVWAMHEEEVKDLVDQLLKADKLITEQQIGWQWKPPDMHALQAVLGKQGGLGLGDPIETEEANQEKITDPEQIAMMEHNKKIAGAKVRAVVHLLAKEAGFMLNADVQKSIESLSSADAEIMKAENLLKSLGIKSEEGLNRLVNYFFAEKSTDPPKFFEDGKDNEVEQEAEDYDNELLLVMGTELGDEISELRDLIKPEDVISAVKSYIEDVNVESGPVSGGSGIGGGTKTSQEEMRIAQKRLASMRNYWHHMSQIVPDEGVEVWKQLELDYQKLRDILEARSKTIEDVDRMTKRNAELKSLLNQYLGDALTNASFQVPPAQTMKVRNVSLTKKSS